MEQRARVSRENAASARSLILGDWVCPIWVRRRPIPIGSAVRAARGTAIHLQRRGFLPRTREPRSERRESETRQTDRSGDVSDGGRSLRSSSSAGKPRTGRREAVVSTALKPPGKAMYVAPRPDWDWLRVVQRKLYTRSEQQVDYVFRKLWGLVTEPRNLRMALARVAGNRGRRTAGVDGVTMGHVAKRAEAFIAELRSELRSGAYRPSPVRRVLIPKIGAPGKFRPLGIPTVKDRVVQAALKNILEPVYEADFFPVSYGFRPGKSVHGALEHLRVVSSPNAALQAELVLGHARVDRQK